PDAPPGTGRRDGHPSTARPRDVAPAPVSRVGGRLPYVNPTHTVAPRCAATPLSTHSLTARPERTTRSRQGHRSPARGTGRPDRTAGRAARHTPRLPRMRPRRLP